MNKKGMDFFAFLMSFVGVLALMILILFMIFQSGALSRNTDGAGFEAVTILQTYQDADNSLLTLDSIVRRAGRDVIKEQAESGFGSSCMPPNGRADFAYWSRGIHAACDEVIELETCVPDIQFQVMKNQMIADLSAEITQLNAVMVQKDVQFDALPTTDHTIEFEDRGDKTLIRGTAQDTMSVTRGSIEHPDSGVEVPELQYEATANFEEIIDVDVETTLTEIRTQLQAYIADVESIEETDPEGEIRGNLHWIIQLRNGQADSCTTGETETIETNCQTVQVPDPVDCVGFDEGGCPFQIDAEICDTESCDVTLSYTHRQATFIVKELDPDYDYLTEDGIVQGYRGFIRDGQRIAYEYRFALDWIEEDGVSESCV